MSLAKLQELVTRDLRLPRLPRSTLAMGGVLAILLILFHRAVFLGQVLYEWDIHLLWHSQAETFVRVVASGSWPVWNPWFGFGQPLLADPNSQVFYPLTWFHLLMPPTIYHTTFLILHLLFSAGGVYLLGRRFEVSPGGSFVAACVWVLSGPLLSLVYVWNHFAAACWIPWVVWAADVAVTARTVGRSLLSGAFMAVQLLAGSPDMSVFTLLAVAGNTLRYLDWKRLGGGTNRQLLALAALALIFALALSAAQWIPSLEAASRSARIHMPAARRLFWSVHPLCLSQLAFPVYLHELPLQPALREALFESRDPFLDSLYLGMPALALAGAAFSFPRRRHLFFLLLASIGGILLALGRHSPVHGYASQLLPVLKMLRYPVKAIILTAFGCALLSGVGFDAWCDAERCRSRHFRILVVGGLLVATGVNTLGALVGRYGAEHWGALLFWRPESGPSYVQILADASLRLAVAGGLSVILLSLALKQLHQARRWSAPVVALLTIADLELTHRNVNLTAPKQILSFRPPAVDVVRSEDNSRLYVYDYYDMNKAQSYLQRIDPYDVSRLPRDWPLQQKHAFAMRTYLYPPGAAVWGIAGSFDMDFLELYPEPLAELTRLIRTQEGTPIHLRLLQVGAVGHVVALHTKGLEDLIALTTLPSPFPEAIRVFRVPHPLPRTYVVSGARIADGPAAIQVLLDSTFDATKELILPDGPSQLRPVSFAGTSRLVAYYPDRLRIEAQLNQPGYVALVDSYDPGWRATVDGEPAPVLRANVAFRAVRVPQGRHLIELVYRPRSLAIGLLISSTALVFGLAFAVRPLRAVKRPRSH